MSDSLPTAADIDELLACVPGLQQPGVKYIETWEGGETDAAGVMHVPYPRYTPQVQSFFRLAARECWADYDYDPATAREMVRDDAFIASATLANVKTMLTFMVRGERFCDGHWGAMLSEGRVQAVLQRLKQIKESLRQP